MSACQTFSSIVADFQEHLTVVSRTARLMIELEPNFDHKVNKLARTILERLELVKSALGNDRNHVDEEITSHDIGETAVESHSMGPGLAYGAFDFSAKEDGLFGMEPLWDLSMMFPST
jgi:hypothetical protein